MLAYVICMSREDYTAPICVIGLISYWFNSLEAVKLVSATRFALSLPC